MNIEHKFNNFIKENTDDGFHDACLISLNINFENQNIQFIIEHCRVKNGKDHYYWTELTFYTLKNLILDNEAGNFGEEDAIWSFDIILKDNIYNFKLIGTEGWVITFAATDFSFKEEYKKDLYGNNE